MSITGCRNDALTLLLNGLGYQPLATAKSGLKAPYVYQYKNRKLEPVGPLKDYLLPDTPMPETERGTVPELAHEKTSKKSGSAVASFLGDALKVVGITSAPKLEASLSHGGDFSFNFDSVRSEGVPYARVSKLLESIDMDTLKRFPPDDLQAGYIHIAYEFLYAESLGLHDSSATEASVDVTGIEAQAIAEVGAKGSVQRTSGTSITLQGASKDRAAFACKIGWLEKRGKKLIFHIHEDSGESFLADEGGPQPYLLERGVVIREEDAVDSASRNGDT